MKLKAFRIAFEVERGSRNSVERFENIHQIEHGHIFLTLFHPNTKPIPPTVWSSSSRYCLKTQCP